ncbi:outer membrane protein assembly factor BamD [Blochmannia endosymbiont of Camponotus sp.]|uniref:outer membrane protein assembly factor BamD n=1 Tax=Blochmannia endosymbiont of Camponotus sp. TaxID=700220 RepID=UPI0020251A16|nr:outer membrane protein assembly factor BamD [Blochmannia endosymbiont of Camponotus sp.]URJ30921.1 outer membrane protein assembly factor BamD [Blochmannia endosymbiont of Camponotus sp.]
MKRVQLHIIIIIIISTIITSYTIASDSDVSCSAYNLYKLAQNKLYNADYKGAVQDLVNLQNLRLFDPCPQQIYLDLIYAHYKLNDFKLANNYIKCFFKLYPNHNHLDYILYMHGVVNMCLDDDNKTLIKYLNMNWFDRNPTYARTAFHSFVKLIHEYPDSRYFADTYRRLVFLKNRIAEYELAIVKFYAKRGAYISVIARVEKMLYCFPDTQATRRALCYMQQAYQNICLPEQAEKVAKIIVANPIY